MGQELAKETILAALSQLNDELAREPLPREPRRRCAEARLMRPIASPLPSPTPMPSFLPGLRCLPLLLTVLLVSAPPAPAHEDPRGDVHPQVRVEKGNFAIYFYSNDERHDSDTQPPPLRVVYSPTGELLAPRHHVAEVPQDEWASRLHGGDIPVAAGGESLSFPPYSRLFHGKPFYTVKKNGRTERHSLPWPDGVEISDLHGIIADERSIMIAAKAGGNLLSFYWFSRVGFQLPTIVKIGSPATIYDFPVASNTVFAGGKYWLAWMRPGEEKTEVVLSSWKPGDAEAEQVVLKTPGNWNSDLSLAATGDVICLAYHCSAAGVYPGRSSIITAFHPLK